MPTTRRSTGGARARPGPTKGQSTISFSNRVTKPVPKDVKNSIIVPSLQKVDAPAPEELDVDDVTAEPEVEEQPSQEEDDVEEVVAAVPEKTDAEIKAEKMSDAQIGKYWRSIEAERKAPRVHQEGLSLNEKVLRYFDVSSQYGPCIGTPRMKRWQRAERLGLSPPIEVLAILLKEENKGNNNIETAQIDKILNSVVVA
ncbi:DNA polymerase delta subunit [Cordyceps fumosorosea ARSEF 2679]|uniref:DNA polymerase delta subunit n=1 Tax=Cordyceps fumosorosea (strain ARSEF 2679) TaxID=1081104 RepID=A0A167VWJ4_CORFA|nr:DNA polymerase delta subunit [Cordyceps fumosorosea ARSEF 2679]OAA63058.1 DNA polymerase delta subunit [Cordyceps fumosorosea ARSEF 2679]